MYARVARWEGADAAGLERFAEMLNTVDGPPEGVPSSGIMLLADAENGRCLVIGLFATEEDLRAGDAALRAMDRPADAPAGDISSVEFYEVTADREMPG